MIFACVNNQTIRRFLSSFIKEKRLLREISLKECNCEFFNNRKELIEALKTRSCDIAILEEENLPALSLLRRGRDGLPVIGVIGRDISRGIQRVSRYRIPFYILPPYRKEDLFYKIISAFQLNQERHLLKAIIDISEKVSTTLDLFEILYHTVKKISEVIPVTRCSIVKVAPSFSHCYVVATYEDPDIRNIRLDLRRYPEIREALKTRRPVIIKDARRDPLMKEVYSFISPLGIRSIIVIPIIYKDETIGALFLRTSRRHLAFSGAEIDFLQTAANASANALYNAFLFDEIKEEKQRLERLAITDYLTGLYNNRYLFHRLDEEFEKAKRYKMPLSCIMMDIDYFKKINDAYGHRKGDSVLKELGRVLKRYTRKGDIVARYGGEEFVILLPHTDKNGAIKEAERLRNLISGLKFKFLDINLTASFGISTWPSDEITDAEDLITIADNALYVAKKEGRNRVSPSSVTPTVTSPLGTVTSPPDPPSDPNIH